MGKSVGLFGLGLIGMALARRLLAAGHTVSGFDVDTSREALLVEAGGTPADPAILWQADILLSAVFSTEQLAEIIENRAPPTITLRPIGPRKPSAAFPIAVSEYSVSWAAITTRTNSAKYLMNMAGCHARGAELNSASISRSPRRATVAR